MTCTAGIKNTPKLFCYISCSLFDELPLSGLQRLRNSNSHELFEKNYNLSHRKAVFYNYGSPVRRFYINLLQNLVHANKEILDNSFLSAPLQPNQYLNALTSIISINVVLCPWETNDLPLLSFNTSESSCLLFKMSCFCENNRETGTRKNEIILPHQNKRLKRTCFVNQALSLLFHPFLIVVFHILFVFPTTAVCLSHRWL